MDSGKVEQEARVKEKQVPALSGHDDTASSQGRGPGSGWVIQAWAGAGWLSKLSPALIGLAVGQSRGGCR